MTYNSVYMFMQNSEFEVECKANWNLELQTVQYAKPRECIIKKMHKVKLIILHHS